MRLDLVVNNIDPVLLKTQRDELVDCLMHNCVPETNDAIEGIISLLDHMLDKIEAEDFVVTSFD